MSLIKSRPLFTVEQYLAIERSSLDRHEYIDGQIYAMAGESDAHGDISANLMGILVPHLKGKPCRARTKDTKVRSGPAPTPGRNTTGVYSYPDIVVICGEPEYHDDRKDIILNPAAIIEVLSPSTEAFDRGVKWLRHQKWNPTLTDYVLVAQDNPLIEHFHRQADGSWSYEVQSGLEVAVVLTAIQCTLKLMDVYDRVTFAEE